MPPALIAGGIAAAGSIVGGVIGAQGAESAAETQAEAAESAAQTQLRAQREAIAAQREMFDLIREEQAPFRELGLESMTELSRLMQPGGFLAEDFSFGLEDFQADPGFQFRLAEGQKALERSAAARGGLLSGRTLKGTERFAQDVAGDEFNRAFSREFNTFMTNRANRFNRLASLAGIGQTATTTTSSAAQTTGANLGRTFQATGANLADIGLQRGNALAAGQAGRASAFSGAAQNIGNLPLQLVTLQSLLGGNRRDRSSGSLFDIL